MPSPLRRRSCCRVGAVNAEAIRQSGLHHRRPTYDALRGLLTVTWTGVSELAEATEDASRTPPRPSATPAAQRAHRSPRRLHASPTRPARPPPTSSATSVSSPTRRRRRLPHRRRGRRRRRPVVKAADTGAAEAAAPAPRPSLRPVRELDQGRAVRAGPGARRRRPLADEQGRSSSGPALRLTRPPADIRRPRTLARPRRRLSVRSGIIASWPGRSISSTGSTSPASTGVGPRRPRPWRTVRHPHRLRPAHPLPPPLHRPDQGGPDPRPGARRDRLGAGPVVELSVASGAGGRVMVTGDVTRRLGRPEGQLLQPGAGASTSSGRAPRPCSSARSTSSRADAR